MCTDVWNSFQQIFEIDSEIILLSILSKTFIFWFLFPDVHNRIWVDLERFFVPSNLSKEAESKSDYRVWFGHYPTSAIVSSAPGTVFFSI